jgi:hypothetical protein
MHYYTDARKMPIFPRIRQERISPKHVYFTCNVTTSMSHRKYRQIMRNKFRFKRLLSANKGVKSV